MPNESPLDGIRSPLGPKRGGGTFVPFIPASSTGLVTADSLVFKSRLDVTAEGWGIAGPEILLAPSAAAPSVPTLTGTILTGPQGTYRIHNVTTDTSTEVEITDETVSHDLALYGASTEVVRAYPMGLSGVSPTIDIAPSASSSISFVGRQLNNVAGRTTSWVTNFALTDGSGSAPLEGDLVLVMLSIACGSARTPTPSIITSGYTSSALIGVSGGTYRTRSIYAYKFMGSTPDTSVEFSQTFNLSDSGTATILVFRGVDPTTPLDVTPTSMTGGGTTAGADKPNPAAITPVTSGAWVVAMGTQALATAVAFTAPTAGLDSGKFWSDTQADAVSGAHGGGYYSGWTNGSHDIGIFNGGSSLAGNAQDAFTIALRPA